MSCRRIARGERWPRLLLEVGFAHLFAGRFINEAPNSNGGDSNYFYSQVGLDF